MNLDVITTSAFGRRSVTRAQIEAQAAVRQARAALAKGGRAAEAGQGRQAAEAGRAAVHKWGLLRTLSEIREGIGVSDRSLGVLSALLSFHPETALTLTPDTVGQGAGMGPSETDAPRFAAGADDPAAGARHGGGRAAQAGLVVFPSNRALSLRCNGMSEATLRRHLSALVEAGLIIRRDSPNGKRFARRDGDGEGVAQAFGFDLAPLVARVGEFEARLEAARAEQRRARLLKERINLLRRDLTKRLGFALDEALDGPWEAWRQSFLELCTPLRKLRGPGDLAQLARALEELQERVTGALEGALARRRTHGQTARYEKTNGDGAHSGRRMTESNPDQFTDIEPVSEEPGAACPPTWNGGALHGDAAFPSHAGASPKAKPLPLAIVLDACPDIRDYDFSGGVIADWPSFVAVAAHVRPMLGVSLDAWREAVASLGEDNAAVALAFILQRCEHSSEAERRPGLEGQAAVTVNGSPAIRSPGGYLRALAQQARREPFTLWGALLGHLAQRAKRRSGATDAATGSQGGGASEAWRRR